MATRTITTVFAVEGEEKYKKAVKEINAALSVLDSELKLSQERFKGQEMSMESLDEKYSILSDVYKEQEKLAGAYAERLGDVKKSMEKMGNEAEELRNSLNQLEATLYNTSENTTSYDEAEKEYRETAEELKQLEKRMANTAVESEKLTKKLFDTQTGLEKLGKEIKDIDGERFEKALGDAAEETEELAEAFEKVEKPVDSTKNALEELATSDAYDRIRDALRTIINVMEECSQASIEFESAVTGVFKTVGGSSDDLKVLSDGIKDLATKIPATTTEIAAVAEAAGQLGIAREDVLDFTEVMIKLGVSTNLSADQAAEALARFANITKMQADDFERLGSVVVDLGNTMATTEEEIVSMATRLAATGELTGLTESQMMAVAAALSAVGIEAEAGGTAFSKLLRNVEKAVAAYQEPVDGIAKAVNSLAEAESELEKYAYVAGMSAEAFKKAWQTDALGAVNAFIQGLGRMDDAGESAVGILGEMEGLAEVRLSNAILALTSSGELLTDAIETANTAWEENTALSEEAARRFETTESKVQILKNTVNNLKIAIGDDLNAAMEPAADLLTDIAENATEAAESGAGMATAVAGVAGALAGITAVAGAGMVIKTVSSALAVFGAAAGPIGLTVAAVSAAAAALSVYTANAYELPEATQKILDANESVLESKKTVVEGFDEINTALDANSGKIEALISKLEEMTDSMDGTKGSQAVVQGVVNELNEMLPGLGLSFDEVTGKVNLTTEAIRDFAEESGKVAKDNAWQEYIDGLVGSQAELEVQLAMTEQAKKDAEKELAELVEQEKAWRDELNDLQELLLVGDVDYQALADRIYILRKSIREFEEQQKTLQQELDKTSETLEMARESYDNFKAGIDIAKDLGLDEGIAEKFGDEIDAIMDELEDFTEKTKAEAERRKQEIEESLKEEVEAEEKAAEEALEIREEYYEDAAKDFDRAQEVELRSFKRAQDERLKAFEKALDAEMDALEEAHNKKLKYIDEEYTAQMKLVDEERYNAIRALEEQIEAIDKLTEAEERAAEEEERREKLAQARHEITMAETEEEREKALKDYNDLVAKYERERTLVEREEQKKRLENMIEATEQEYEKRKEALEEQQTAAEEAAQDEYDAAVEAKKKEQEDKLQIFKDGLEDELYWYQRHQDELKQAYQERLDEELEADKEAIEQKKQENISALEEKAETEKAQIDKIAQYDVETAATTAEHKIALLKKAIAINIPSLRSQYQQAGANVMDGFIRGMESKSTALGAAAERLARSALERMRTELEVRSPSKKTMEIGRFFGEGLEIGIEEKVEAVKMAAQRMADGMDISSSVQNEIIKANDGLRKLGESVRARTETPDDTLSATKKIGSATGKDREEERGDTYWNITIPAKDIKEFNDIVRIAQTQRVTQRMGKTGG